MAKSKTLKVKEMGEVPHAEIICNWKDNVRVEGFDPSKGTNKSLIADFMDPDIGFLTVGLDIPCVALATQKEIDEELATRQEYLDTLEKTANSAEATRQLRVEKTRLLDESGKLRVPKYRLATGYNRYSCLMVAWFRMYIKACTGVDIPPDPCQIVKMEMPIIVVNFKDANDRREKQLIENIRKKQCMELTLADKLNATLALVRGGCGPGKIRKSFKPTESQRLYHFVVHSLRFKELDLFRRVLDIKHPSYIKWSKLRINDLPQFTTRSSQEALAEWNANSENPKYEPLDQVELAAHYDKISSGKSDVGQMMPKTKLTKIAENNDCELVKTIVSGIVQNDENVIPNLVPLYDVLNTIDDLKDRQCFELVCGFLKWCTSASDADVAHMLSEELVSVS